MNKKEYLFKKRLGIPYSSKVRFLSDELLVIGGSNEITIKNIETEETSKITAKNYINAMDVLIGQNVIIYSEELNIRLVDIKGKKLLDFLIDKKNEGIYDICFGGETLLIIGAGHMNSPKSEIVVYDWKSKTQVREFIDPLKFGFAAVGFVRNSAVSFRDGQLELWNIKTGQISKPLKREISNLNAAKISSSEDMILICTGSSTIPGLILLNSQGQILWRKNEEYQTASISKDGDIIGTANRAKIDIFMKNGKIMQSIERKFKKDAKDICFSENKQILAVCTDGCVEIYSNSEVSKERERGPKKLTTKAKTIEEAWKNIEKWLSLNAPEINSQLAMGATKKDINNLERNMCLILPTEFKESLELHNGDGNSGLIGGWDLLAVSEIQKVWNSMKKMNDDGKFKDAKTKRHPKIQQKWWDEKWIPIVESGSGHYICIDMNPSSKGTVGQIIMFLHDEPQRFVIARSFLDWICQIANDLSDDKYEYVKESHSFSSEAFMDSSLEGKKLYG